MSTGVPVPEFYLDWQFWSAVAAYIALALTLFPKIKMLLIKGKLTIDKHGKVSVFHGVGTPNLNVFLILRNVGGKSISIQKLEMIVEKADEGSFVLNGDLYYVNPHDTQSTLLTPMRIEVGQEWSHTVQFYLPWERSKEKKYRKIQSKVRDAISEQVRSNPQRDETELFTASSEDIDELMSMFDQNFKWTEGEYNIQVVAKDNEDNILATSKSRFTLFESDSEDLRSWADEYKYGFGICLQNSYKQAPIQVTLNKP
ncbi:hypothetical protein [Vibrio nigripulchritudo]|uniref:hypothetical protein n=1 Tax=Vibrio nigripulchritudo TaxID=28173 RepID=UPI00249233EA|nr:hypothetical protein [Vibrio nigripulchritudo]BDU36562.1 hypothetical protein TUMSATVNIG2_10310 [Vibrio nigripulchritudo]BDU42271.1 hypothetical protein TUMSATVNIG3_10690 [Vibrio nigripulchritudo]